MLNKKVLLKNEFNIRMFTFTCEYLNALLFLCFFVNLFMNEQMDKDFSLLKYIYDCQCGRRKSDLKVKEIHLFELPFHLNDYSY